ncbi:MAG: hypothetical protein E7442_06660 [Ruminococcaceae bacterium]|nr:hypothetical protein [Oscillospiraceae bacterium]
MQKVTNRLAPFLLGAASLFIAVTALLFCLFAGGKPLILSVSGSPEDTVTAFMDELCRGSYEAASACCLVPLPDENAPTDTDAALLYRVLRENTDWELSGALRRSGRLAQAEILLHQPDAAALTADLKEAVLARLSEYVEEAAHSSDIYKEDGSYRDEVVMQAWDDALQGRLDLREEYMTTTFLLLSLTAEDGSWKIVPDEALIRALSGGV